MQPLVEVEVLLADPQVHCDLLYHADLLLRGVLHHADHLLDWVHLHQTAEHQSLLLPKDEHHRHIVVRPKWPHSQEPLDQVLLNFNTVQQFRVTFGVVEEHHIQLHGVIALRSDDVVGMHAQSIPTDLFYHIVNEQVSLELLLENKNFLPTDNTVKGIVGLDVVNLRQDINILGRDDHNTFLRSQNAVEIPLKLFDPEHLGMLQGCKQVTLGVRYFFLT